MDWWTNHKREIQKHKKKNEIFSHIFNKKSYLGPFLWFRLFWEPHKPTAYWASSNNDSNAYT